MFDQETLNSILLYSITAIGAVSSGMWLALIIWTWRDMRNRSRDPLAQIAAALVVAVLGLFGIIIYVMLRPSETLAEAYERSLEEEALLQNIEEKPICPGCGRPSQANWQVCPYCHTKLKKPCVQCEHMLELPWNLCPYCATVQAVEPEPAAQQPSRRSLASQMGRRPAPPPGYANQEAVEFIEDDSF
jgi:hypothetical protein